MSIATMSRVCLFALLLLVIACSVSAQQQQQQHTPKQHPLQEFAMRMQQLRNNVDQMMQEFDVLDHRFGGVFDRRAAFAPLSPAPFAPPSLGRLGRPFVPALSRQQPPHQLQQQHALWQPRVDVKEDDGVVLITAELPGVDAADVKVDIEGDYLTLSGTRHHKHETDRWGMHVSECEFGHFERAFYLPEGLNRDEVVASLDDGVLDISIPKLAKALAKKSVPVLDQDRLVVEDTDVDDE
jgi:HSP20 family molecular chaperone IbpA